MRAQELLLTCVRKCQRIDLYTNPRPLTTDEEQLLSRMSARYKSGEPLQYILGECDFLGNTLTVNHDVLIPRPETEILVDTIIKKLNLGYPNQPLKILDLGTGSGNIAIALAKAVDSCFITTMDISPAAIKIAKQNALNSNVSARIEFICDDMTTSLISQPKWLEHFDCIISNPPYIKTSDLKTLPRDVQQEPLLALDGGVDGLKFYRSIVANAYKYLKPQGFLFFEIGDGQAPLINTLIEQSKCYQDFCVYKDYTQTDRIISICRKG